MWIYSESENFTCCGWNERDAVVVNYSVSAQSITMVREFESEEEIIAWINVFFAREICKVIIAIT
jgi:hypothetical protein